MDVMFVYQNYETRFFEKVRIADILNPLDSCWEWTGADNGTGYGIVGIGGHVLLMQDMVRKGRHRGPKKPEQKA